MRYIGPFFRMNSLSQKEISGQLFYLAKESVKTIVLNSKCGLLAQVRVSKKSSINDISILNNFSPLVCLYRKSSPMFVHSKSTHGFDESSFKKEINPSTNAFMTLCLLELSEYYSHYNKDSRNVVSLEKAFKYLAKEQLQFFSENLRNNEGLFVDKKNTSDGNSKGFTLIDKDTKFKFSDQAFMMDAYYLYSHYNESDTSSNEYSNFSYEILEMFKEYKDSLYDLSFTENTQIFLALNIFYKYSKNEDAQKLLLDLGDLLISKFQEKDYYSDSIDDCALFSICLMDAYKHTEIISFKETAREINEKLISLYDSDKNIFVKLSDKKDSKYSCTEINSYLLSLVNYSIFSDKVTELKPIISGIYKKFFVNNGLLTSWPEAPTLDEVERYKKLSLRSDDMLDETYFRMPIMPTPQSTGIAPIFVKSLSYSRKKDSLSVGRSSFDSNKNMFNFLLIIYLFKDAVENVMEFKPNTEDLAHSDIRAISGAKDIVDENLDSDLNDSIIKENISAVNSTPILINNLNVNNNNKINDTSDLEIPETIDEISNDPKSITLKTHISANTNNKSDNNKSSKPKKYKKNKAKHPAANKK